jgi:hypothetical protein
MVDRDSYSASEIAAFRSRLLPPFEGVPEGRDAGRKIPGHNLIHSIDHRGIILEFLRSDWS